MFVFGRGICREVPLRASLAAGGGRRPRGIEVSNIIWESGEVSARTVPSWRNIRVLCGAWNDEQASKAPEWRAWSWPRVA